MNIIKLACLVSEPFHQNWRGLTTRERGREEPVAWVEGGYVVRVENTTYVISMDESVATRRQKDTIVRLGINWEVNKFVTSHPIFQPWRLHSSALLIIDVVDPSPRPCY